MSQGEGDRTYFFPWWPLMWYQEVLGKISTEKIKFLKTWRNLPKMGPKTDISRGEMMWNFQYSNCQSNTKNICTKFHENKEISTHFAF